MLVLVVYPIVSPVLLAVVEVLWLAWVIRTEPDGIASRVALNVTGLVGLTVLILTWLRCGLLELLLLLVMKWLCMCIGLQ